jgi:hypothetical protein
VTRNGKEAPADEGPVQFVIEAIAVDVGKRDRLWLFGEDRELEVRVAAGDEPDDGSISVDGKPWDEDAPLLRLVGTLHADRYRVQAIPLAALGGAAIDAAFTKAEGDGRG